MKFKKSDFIIKGHFTGSKLYGRENQFLYQILMPNYHKLTDKEFTSKVAADKYLADVLREYNEMLKTGKLMRPKHIKEIYNIEDMLYGNDLTSL